MRPLADIARDLRDLKRRELELLDELEAHVAAPPRQQRRRPGMREARKLALVPNELQREKARRILLGKGAIR